MTRTPREKMQQRINFLWGEAVGGGWVFGSGKRSTAVVVVGL